MGLFTREDSYTKSIRKRIDAALEEADLKFKEFMKIRNASGGGRIGFDHSSGVASEHDANRSNIVFNQGRLILVQKLREISDDVEKEIQPNFGEKLQR